MDSEIELTPSSGHNDPQGSSVALSSIQRTSEDDHAFSLPLADTGKDAWLFLAAGFMIEALIWGFPFTFGIFQEWYTHHEPFSSDASNVAVIGTSASGIMYMGTMILMPCYGVWPWIRRISAFVGLPILVAGIILASLANNVSQLILTQGVCYGIGGALLYCPTVLFLDEWFVRRKGFAFGVMWAGTGASGMILPFVINWSLEAFGFRTVLRAWAVLSVVCLSPLLYFLKPRLPVPRTRQARPLDLKFLVSPAFWTLEMSNILQSLGYFLPSIYLPTIAQSYGSSSTGAALTLVFLNLAAIFGGLIVGALIDRFHVTSVMMLVATGSAISVFLVWGFSQSLPLLIVFGILYGLSAGGFSTCWPGVIKELQREHAGADTGMLFGFLGAGRGVGAVVSGPLSAALLQSASLQGLAYAYGSNFGGVIIFTGVTAAAGSLGYLARKLSLI